MDFCKIKPDLPCRHDYWSGIIYIFYILFNILFIYSSFLFVNLKIWDLKTTKHE